MATPPPKPRATDVGQGGSTPTLVRPVDIEALSEGLSAEATRLAVTIFECYFSGPTLDARHLTWALCQGVEQHGGYTVPDSVLHALDSFAAEGAVDLSNRDIVSIFINKLCLEVQATVRATPSRTNTFPRTKTSPFASRRRQQHLVTTNSSKRAAMATLSRRRTVTGLSDDEQEPLDGWSTRSLQQVPDTPYSEKSDLSMASSDHFSQDSIHSDAPGSLSPLANKNLLASPSWSAAGFNRRLSDTFSPSEIHGYGARATPRRSLSPPRSFMDALDPEGSIWQREQVLKANTTAIQEAAKKRYQEELAQTKRSYEHQLSQHARKHDHERSKLESANDELKSELSTQRRQMQECRSRVDKQTIQLSILETDMSNMTKELSNSRANYLEIKRQLDSTTQELDEVRRNYDLKERDYQKALKHHQAFIQEHQSTVAENQSLTQALESLTVRLESLEGLEQEIHQLEDDKQILEDTVDRLKDDLQRSRALVEQLTRHGQSVSVLEPAAVSAAARHNLQRELAATGALGTDSEDEVLRKAYGDRLDILAPLDASLVGAVRHQGVQTDSGADLMDSSTANVVAELMQEKQQFRTQLAEALAVYESTCLDLDETRKAHQADIEGMRQLLAQAHDDLARVSAAQPLTDTSGPALPVGADRTINPQNLDIRSFTRAVTDLVQTLHRKGQHVQANSLSHQLLQLVLEYSEHTWASRSIFATSEDELPNSSTAVLTSSMADPTEPSITDGQQFRRGLRHRKRTGNHRSSITRSAAVSTADANAHPTAPPSSKHVTHTKGFTTCQVTTFVLYTLVVYFLGFLTLLFTTNVNLDYDPLTPSNAARGYPAAGSLQSHADKDNSSAIMTGQPPTVQSPSASQPWPFGGSGAPHGNMGAAGMPLPPVLYVEDPPLLSARHPRNLAHVKRSRTADVFMYWLETLLYNGDVPQIPT
ncbi:hypothetical protein H4R34_003392 [Dimargaris verticillata]|uniref:Uncharacterized protein n=1 Tax=Dimargaris verticillata TaxID=2761393 RepID=A0A9W8B0T0_9FUNG|nr:hypothetical protein H4R34_003392 [Dimargaris verticillata]